MVEAIEPRLLLSLTVTPAGQAAGFRLSTFATGFPNSNTVGPLGIAFPSTGGVLVDDELGNVRLFPTDTDGQDAAAVPPVSGATYGTSDTAGIARVGDDLYMMMPGALSQIAQINDNGTLKKVIATGVSPLGVATDPLNGHLFVSSFNNKVYDVDPVTGAVSVLLDVGPDGLAFDASTGILYTAFPDPGEGDQVEGFNITTKKMVFDSGTIAGGPDGIVLGAGPMAGDLFANTNGGTLVEVNLKTAAQTVIASGGSRGDFVVVDPNNGSLLVTQSDRIMRLVPAVFDDPPYQLTTTTKLEVTQATSTSGQSVTLTAVVGTAAGGIPTGTVTFTIDGHVQTPVRLTEVGGLDQATFTTSTLTPGTDAITAIYSGDSTFASSTAEPVSVTIIPADPTGPTGPTAPAAPTRTVLKAQPKPANVGRPLSLTATVKNLKRRGPTPIGIVKFMDGEVSLGTAALSRGKASLKTSSLPVGPNQIEAYYVPGQGFARSTASVVENVRAQKSRSKAVPAVETHRRAAAPSAHKAIRVGVE